MEKYTISHKSADNQNDEMIIKSLCEISRTWII